MVQELLEDELLLALLVEAEDFFEESDVDSDFEDPEDFSLLDELLDASEEPDFSGPRESVR